MHTCYNHKRKNNLYIVMDMYKILIALLGFSSAIHAKSVKPISKKPSKSVNHCAVCLEPSPFSKPFSASLYSVSNSTPQPTPVNFAPWFIPRSTMGQDANPLNAIASLQGSHSASNNAHMLNAYF